MNEPRTEENRPKSNVNTIMSFGTLIYLAAIFFGGLFHFFYPTEVTSDPSVVNVGLALILLATGIIFWAAASARKLVRDMALSASVEVFKTGAYGYTRNPTYLGLFLLIIGFGFLANSLPIIIAAIIAFIFIRFTTLKKEEQALEDKFGEVYRQYKSEIRRWL